MPAAILFLGLKPAFSMSLKNSTSPSIATTKNNPATEYLFQTIAPISTKTKTRPVSALTTISFNSYLRLVIKVLIVVLIILRKFYRFIRILHRFRIWNYMLKWPFSKNFLQIIFKDHFFLQKHLCQFL